VNRVIAKHNHTFDSVSSLARDFMFGTSEMLLSDVLRADFDVEYAAKRFKFALVPKVRPPLIPIG
jgi:hypothetical protein